MKIIKFFQTIVITLFIALFTGCNRSSDSSSNNTSLESSLPTKTTVQKETEPVTISFDEAFALAESQVPSAIKENSFMKNATNYKITDYEYLGINNNVVTHEDEYKFIFYGLWYEINMYDELIDDGKFKATIYVNKTDGSSWLNSASNIFY